MRVRGLAIVLGLGLTLGACKSKPGDASGSADSSAASDQRELIARRDALLAARQKLQNERDQVDKQIADAEAQGSDATELRKKRAELESQLESNSSDALSLLSSKLDAIEKSGDRRESVTAREQEVAEREKAVAEREARVADREKALVQRDFELSQRWKDTCSVASPPVIIQAAAPKGGNFTKSDVSGLVARAKSAMARKGLITSDLPGPAQALEDEASKALDGNDTSKAYFAAQQLYATVEAIRVDRPFIQAKTARLQAQIKRTHVDDASQQQLATALGDVMQKYNAGDFIAANRRLNQIAQLLAR